ncbi:hypothetical protein G7Y79_00046g082530 [Physcia stellaris]|nr:hypothetical protein G7Y79_00046g082530 [Physcia stellaris]
MTSRIEGWLNHQGPDYEPLQLPPNDLSAGNLPPNVKQETKAPGSCCEGSMTKSKTTPHVPMVPAKLPSSSVDMKAFGQSATSLLPTMSDRNAKQDELQGRPLGNQSLLSGSKPADQSTAGRNEKTKKPREVHKIEVKNLECAYEATGAYCRELGLKRNVINYANLLLHQIFFDKEFEDRSIHTMIAGCIAIARDEKIKWQKWLDIFALTHASRSESYIKGNGPVLLRVTEEADFTLFRRPYNTRMPIL